MENLTGKKFARLTVLSFHHKDKKYNTYWLCQCECGNIRVVRATHLKNGEIKSCGCYIKELVTKRNKENTRYDGLSNHRLYSIWKLMIGRCYNPKINGYNNYGGRGIIICQNWLENYLNFYNWAISNGYKNGLSIERIDVNGNYEPNNCKWITLKQQYYNKRNNFIITYKNKTHCLAEWAEILGINKNTLRSRLTKYGWSVEKAFETLVKNKGDKNE